MPGPRPTWLVAPSIGHYTDHALPVIDRYGDQMTDPALTAVLDMHLLLQLGGRLKRLRVAQGLTTTEIAQRVGITRNTLRAIESGDPATSLGSYLRVMSALGVSGDLALLATGAVQQPAGSAAAGGTPAVEVRVSAARGRHSAQDLQSLLLHEAAVRHIKANPALLGRARDALLSWSGASAEEPSRSAPLWNEWLEILEQRAWRKVLARTQHAQQLRQASPLLGVLPPQARQEVLAQVAELKRGVTLVPASARQGRPAGADPPATTLAAPATAGPAADPDAPAPPSPARGMLKGAA